MKGGLFYSQLFIQEISAICIKEIPAGDLVMKEMQMIRRPSVAWFQWNSHQCLFQLKFTSDMHCVRRHAVSCLNLNARVCRLAPSCPPLQLLLPKRRRRLTRPEPSWALPVPCCTIYNRAGTISVNGAVYNIPVPRVYTSPSRYKALPWHADVSPPTTPLDLF